MGRVQAYMESSRQGSEYLVNLGRVSDIQLTNVL